MIVSGSSLGLLLTCAVILILIIKWKKLGRLHDAMSPATTSAVNRRCGMALNIFDVYCYLFFYALIVYYAVSCLLLTTAWKIML